MATEVEAQGLLGSGQLLESLRALKEFLGSEDLKATLAGIREIVEFIKGLIGEFKPAPGSSSAQAIDPATIAMIVQAIRFLLDLIRQWKAAQPAALPAAA